MISNMVKVSIILPSLNVVQYIRECLESVVNQSVREIEIICVDAGSTDGTLEILQEFAQKDIRVKLIVSDKKSYGYQMNLGIASATGEYIGIVETDDYVPLEMYEELYLVAKENDVDFVKSDFYRFTGDGNQIKKALYRLSGDSSYYNRIIDISEELECFRFPINTWSGIYKREFLLANDINHNETLGASFQDNGFWFQTFAFAKRAYFVDKAYYMNRRDNPGSSVYSKNKVYCICDEYENILSILSRNKKLFDNYKFVFSFACYHAYKGNLERISSEYKLEFIERFSKDFKLFREQNILDNRMFSEVDWSIILNIINNPIEYYKQEIVRKEEMLEIAKKYTKVIIYGAGMVGKRVLHELTYNENPVNVIGFAVSKIEENFSSVQGVAVYNIDELVEYKHDSLVIIATTEVYQGEIISKLKALNFKNVLVVPEVKEKKFKANNGNINEQLKEWYYYTTGKNLNIKNPLSCNEKMQWLKINDITDLKVKLADKYEAREWVRNKIGEKYLNPVIGIYSDETEILFSKLPESFIIKCTHGCGFNVHIKNKYNEKEFNEDVIRRKLKVWLKTDYLDLFSTGFDIIYKNAKRQIIVEEVVENQIKHDVYKIVCVEGMPEFVIYDSKKANWGGRQRDIYDISWKIISGTIKYPNSDKHHARPKYLEEMLKVAKLLSKEFKFVVVHLFETENGVLFNELKFTLGNGVEEIIPYELDEMLSSRIRIE